MTQVVYFIEGDGIGPEIWAAARPVLDAAVKKASAGARKIEWREILAGEKALNETGEYLPQETIDTLRQAEFAIKGPLTTPVGGGFRSLNVALRQILDLYACIRPIRYYPGIVSPVRNPEKVDMIVFRENTEDVYAGIEYESGSQEAKRLISFLREELGANVDLSAGVGIKPMTEHGSKRLVRKAIQYALAQGKPSVTLVHKGNIMKFTEGAFARWGYELAAAEFGGQTTNEADEAPGSRLVIKDRIADNMFQQALMKPELYSVLATPNLNGDYLSDALAAQVGGLGIAPGMNCSDQLAFFEATHGTAPKHAGKDTANPGSILLSGAMMLEQMGLPEAAALVQNAMVKTIASKHVPRDLAAQMEGAVTVGCREFGELLLAAI
ncbi:MAG: NADP-dependent isocitrate dehydrogenase [Desulfovibrionaceae bacterium]|nr:NADP-dependent isocitrate dehydrogenase [Desulfovibrionaceae bacterium]